MLATVEPEAASTSNPSRDKLALVVGAGGGIGGKVVQSLLNAGWIVAGIDRRFTSEWEHLQATSARFKPFMAEAADWAPHSGGFGRQPDLVVVCTRPCPGRREDLERVLADGEMIVARMAKVVDPEGRLVWVTDRSPWELARKMLNEEELLSFWQMDDESILDWIAEQAA